MLPQMDKNQLVIRSLSYMKKNCFLGEVAIVASNLFLDDFKKFNFDVVKTLDSWDEKIEGKVSSDYDKLAIKLCSGQVILDIG
jgi:hypothetical protein